MKHGFERTKHVKHPRAYISAHNLGPKPPPGVLLYEAIMLCESYKVDDFRSELRFFLMLTSSMVVGGLVFIACSH